MIWLWWPLWGTGPGYVSAVSLHTLAVLLVLLRLAPASRLAVRSVPFVREAPYWQLSIINMQSWFRSRVSPFHFTVLLAQQHVKYEPIGHNHTRAHIMKSLTGNPSSCTRRSRSCLGRCGKGSPCRWGCRRCCRPLGSPCLTSCNTTCASATRTAWRSCLPITIFRYLQGVHKKFHFSFPVRRAKVNFFCGHPVHVLEQKYIISHSLHCGDYGAPL